MRNSLKRLFVVAAFIACMTALNPAWSAPPQIDYTPSAAAMAVDALLIRPVCLVATVAGAGLFVVSLPFSLLGWNVDEAANKLVVEPGVYTFLRPLGDFHADGEAYANR